MTLYTKTHLWCVFGGHQYGMRQLFCLYWACLSSFKLRQTIC
ncbi:hypothetical protein VAE063_940240 [Vibrio aestuarianus]|uniref:Uncharacterized protein n=1 Tax=Vibrio aestuarianus TaxID=28171 RepID=A0ABM9FPM2_9VIBR|nr:hypothetical protein VAE063_940240 [Vibrio aestuarianus]